MDYGNILYILGLILVLLFVFTGIDDFFWDIITIFKRLTTKNKKIDMGVLYKQPPKLIALIVAAWHEENVLFDVIENIILSQQYPQSMYHIFLGVYPNDEATIQVAKNLEEKYKNVHCIINLKNGPTSKAQNINYVFSRIKEFEERRGWEFATFTIHDSEDVVHPYEFKVTNYLIDKHPALQFPVFPLIKKPTLSNFFSNITTNTYADEFAENHFITMVGRHKSGAFVPSAGTGFSLSRQTIESLGEKVLPEESITEDYRLSLTLYEKGIQMYYVLEKIERYDSYGKVSWDYIATRSMFPNTFKTAVKQKTRWTLGITMQSYRLKDLFKNNIPFIGRYSLYRDQKAKISNLLSVLGYPVLIYFIISLFFPLIAIYPLYSPSWYLSLVVTVMMIERQVFRGIALYNVYGMRSVFYGVLFPPFLPIRIIWGNIINLVSTYKAYIQFFNILPRKSKRLVLVKKMQAEEMNTKKNIGMENIAFLNNEKERNKVEKKIQEKKFDWAKTEHSFLEQDVLMSFRRNLGDILVMKGYLEAYRIKDLLATKKAEVPLGTYLLKNKFITEAQLMESLAAIKHVPYLKEEALCHYDFTKFNSDFDKECLYNFNVLPLLETREGYVFAYSDKSSPDAQSLIGKKLNKKLNTVLATNDTIIKGLEKIWNKEKETNKLTDTNYLDYTYCEKLSDPEQVVIIKNYAAILNKKEVEIIKLMGLD